MVKNKKEKQRMKRLLGKSLFLPKTGKLLILNFRTSEGIFTNRLVTRVKNKKELDMIKREFKKENYVIDKRSDNLNFNFKKVENQDKKLTSKLK